VRAEAESAAAAAAVAKATGGAMASDEISGDETMLVRMEALIAGCREAGRVEQALHRRWISSSSS